MANNILLLVDTSSLNCYRPLLFDLSALRQNIVMKKLNHNRKTFMFLVQHKREYFKTTLAQKTSADGCPSCKPLTY